MAQVSSIQKIKYDHLLIIGAVLQQEEPTIFSFLPLIGVFFIIPPPSFFFFLLSFIRDHPLFF